MLVGNSLCGMLLQRYAWPIAFYVLGSVGCVFSVLHVRVRMASVTRQIHEF